MVHRLTESRLFMVTLAALMLLAFMPWQGALGCQGEKGADGSPCCCCGVEDAVATGSCCKEPSTPAPEAPAPDPCPCIQAEQAVGLPVITGPNHSEQAPLALSSATAPMATVDRAMAGVPNPLPRARNGPLLHLRLKVLLI